MSELKEYRVINTNAELGEEDSVYFSDKEKAYLYLEEQKFELFRFYWEESYIDFCNCSVSGDFADILRLAKRIHESLIVEEI